MTSRPAWYVATLLALLSVLMGGHLLLLQTGIWECSSWSKVLTERLRRTSIGSPQAEILRNELRQYLDGKQSECADIESVYAETSDKYLSVLLALLTGASAIGGVAMGMQNRDK